jgi:class 3 adenylate cyclase
LLGAVVLNPVDPTTGPKLDLAAEDHHDHLQRVAPGRTSDPAYRAWFSRARRMGASGAQTRSFYEAAVESGSRIAAGLAPMHDAPPILLIRRRDAADDAGQRWWKNIFSDAECLTIEGADSVIEALDAGLVAELTAGFITGGPIAAPIERHLVALLFTDLVDSTPAAAATGDAGWRSTLDRYEATLHRSIERHHGVVVKHTGDGALATFPSGSEALAAAVELRGATRDVDLEGRTGIHVGEVEQRGDDIGGIAVHVAARVMAEAGPGEIVVTPTVSLSSLGGGHRFSRRGARTLKGFEQPWELFAVELND